MRKPKEQVSVSIRNDIFSLTFLVLPYFKTGLFADDDDLEPKEVNISDGLFDYLPEKLVNDRVVRVYKEARNPLMNGEENTKPWRFQLGNQETWVNQLMGYASTGDAADSGITGVKFDTLDDAKVFLESRGLSYYVDKPYVRPNLDGEKQYGYNFLNYHVQGRRAKWSKKKLCQVQFAHPERGTDCWVNLKHSKFGDKASSKVSMTHWTDPHPNKLTPKSWHMNTLLKKQELARKLGK